MKVLLATDGSREALEAESLLGAVGDRSRVELTTMSVDYLGWAVPEMAPFRLPPIVKQATAAEVVKASVTRLERAGFDVKGDAIEGRPGEEIVRAVETGGYELTIMGTTSQRAGRTVLGSAAAYVVHWSPSPVLTVRDSSHLRTPAKVVLVVDGSRDSGIATTVLTRFADPQRCRVAVLAVVDPGPYPHRLPVRPYEYVSEQEWVMRHVKWAQANADGAVSDLSAAGFPAVTVFRAGAVPGAVLDEAHRADLLVVAARSSGPYETDPGLGPVASALMPHVPALMVGRRLANRSGLRLVTSAG